MAEERENKRQSARRTAAAILVALSAVLLVLAVLIGLDARHVRFYIAGTEEITVPYGVPYEEPGVRAVSVGRLTGEGGELPVAVNGAVDTGAMGDYELSYEARAMLRSYRIRRLVHVADLTPPQIRLERREDYTPSWLDGYEEEGYSARDDVDGDLTAQVRVEKRGDTWIYTVTDAAGNEGRAVRRLPYSIGTPVLTLNGEAEMEVGASFHFDDPGFSACDARGNDLSAYVRRTGEVVPYTAGDYELRYTLENALGERVEAVRHVTVHPLRNPDTVDPGSKVICLTFDDGPGPYTERLLDVLGRYNVKATFFVTCRYPDYFDCIGRAYTEGHSIGVHSASHNYRAVYASEEAFFADFEAAEELIYAQTGSYTSLCRFPGGSSNTVSRFNRGIMSRLTQAVEDMGYQYFDWNVSSGDAGETTSTARVVSNIVEGCSAHEVSVVLQHDIKDFSVDAVEQVIVWGLSNGYVFAPLDSTSPPVHHNVAN